MKKILFYCILFCFFSYSFFAEDTKTNISDENVVTGNVIEISDNAMEILIDEAGNDEAESTDEINEKQNKAKIKENSKYNKPGKKRPKKADAEKAEAAAKKDENEKTVEEYRSTLKFGIADEISELLNKLIDNEDPRFVEEVYDLFEMTRSAAVKEKVLAYFGKIEDPCLEDYAVTILEDPFDEKKSTVQACFQYVQKVHCVSAVPAVLRLIENENEDYFNDALTTIGDIGGAEEALSLSEFLDKDELTDAQKQALMKTLGKIHAVETWDKLVEIAENEDENLFVRSFAAEAIGAMEKIESVPVLVRLFEDNDPNFRTYVLKGLEYFPDILEAKEVLVQAVRDDHYKVRLEAIDAVKKQNLKDAIPYLVYRAKNDPEEKVKMKSYECIAFLNTEEGNEFLVDRVREKKGSDTQKSKAVEVLLKEGHCGEEEIKELAIAVAQDDKRKPLRNALGKHIAKYPRDCFDEVCIKYLESKDTTTQSLGLEMYQNGKYQAAIPALQKIADDKKANAGNKRRAKRLLGLEEE